MHGFVAKVCMGTRASEAQNIAVSRILPPHAALEGASEDCVACAAATAQGTTTYGCAAQ